MPHPGDNHTTQLLERLLEHLGSLESLAVGYSGGVDSSVVMAAAYHALGPERVLAVTAQSETLPAQELSAAKELAARIGVPHVVIQTRELDCDDFSANPPDRCYYCKNELWGRVRRLTEECGIKEIADGVNADDTGDFRPGIQAGTEAGVLHPLAEIGAGKDQVRSLAQALGLTNWNKPAQACLSSRFPYGQRITIEALKRVEQAEDYLHSLGFAQLRVRDHSSLARVEVPAEVVTRLLDAALREQIVARLKELGYTYVTLDLQGFRSGSMNEAL